MRTFMRSLVTVLMVIGVALVVASATRAEEMSVPVSVADKNAPVYGAVEKRPGAGVESVLTDPRGLVVGTKRGTGWLLHYGTERDNCSRVDANPGLRMMCVAW